MTEDNKQDTQELARQAVWAQEGRRVTLIALGIIAASASLNILALFDLGTGHWFWSALLIVVAVTASIAAYAAMVDGKIGELRTGLDISGRYVSARVGMGVARDQEPKAITLLDWTWVFIHPAITVGSGLATASLPAIICLCRDPKLGSPMEGVELLAILFVLMGPSMAFALSGRVGPRI